VVHIGSYEAKTHLPALLKRVEEGEKFTITRHGNPIARLIPMDEAAHLTAGEAVDELMAFRRGRIPGSGEGATEPTGRGRE
jgi:prevent-host-death family protein